MESQNLTRKIKKLKEIKLGKVSDTILCNKMSKIINYYIKCQTCQPTYIKISITYSNAKKNQIFKSHNLSDQTG